MTPIRRQIATEVKVLDSKSGAVEYIASDETLDSYREIIRANGWRFTHFAKNAPFVDSHDYSSIDKLMGRVTDFGLQKLGNRSALVERVQWAIDVPDNKLAQLGWKMTESGYLKAVSVGFAPVRTASKWDSDRTNWLQQLDELGLHEEDGIRAIYMEQEQLELSSVILGANPNALAKAYKADVLTEQDIDWLAANASIHQSTNPFIHESTCDPALAAVHAADAAWARQRQRQEFLEQLEKLIRKL